MNFHDFLLQQIELDGLSTEDVLSSFLPLVREVIEAHRAGMVAPLEGLQALNVEGTRVWFEEAKRQPVRRNLAALNRVEEASRVAVEVLQESRRTTEVGDDSEQITRADVGVRGLPIERPVYLPGYVCWEHELQHQDPLTDIYCLGLILASLGCGLNLNEPVLLVSFVAHRRNLFALNASLHPVLAQAILRMTELDRHRRAQDLSAILLSLENYRDQTVAFEIDLARLPGLQSKDTRSKTHVVLSRLRDRLFDISRRNTLLHFRATMNSVNLTQASIPLLLDIRNIRPDQLLIWNDRLQKQIADGSPIPLNKHLNFAEAVYLPSLLERIISDARRDQQELGFAQLRLVVCFLNWANLKVKPAETYVSPLVLLPVKLTKNKGIRDTYYLDPLGSEAEVNPVLRHQFKQLYDIDLPETIDLATGGLDSLFEYLQARIQASEPAVSISRIDRPRIDLIHEKAKRRLDQYRRNARLSGRGIRHFMDLDYSYDVANYHPLGIKLFSARVRTPGSRLRDIIEERPRPRMYIAPDSAAEIAEKERSFFHLRDGAEANPYLWTFDLCSVTVANFRYRRMSLVRDYEAILDGNRTNAAFEDTFSLAPRPVGRELPPAPPLEERFDVVPCDPTQATAIAEARRGASYIIQGPPGTGKSQTITNLIADYVAQGKRVLFVCEKRAAIDVVYARLRQSGLGGLCCLIHDSQTDKKEFVLDLKQTYESLLEEKSAKQRVDEERLNLLREIQDQLSPLEKFGTAMESQHPLCGLAVRKLLDRCIQLRVGEPCLLPEVAERLPMYAEWWSARGRLAAAEPAIRDLESSGILAKHPLRLLAPELSRAEHPIEIFSTAVVSGLEYLNQLIVSLKATELPADRWNTLHRAEALIQYARQLDPFVQTGDLSLIEPTSERSKQFTRTIESLRELESALTTARQATVAWNEKLPPADLTAALEQARRWDGKTFAFLSPSWWRLRGVLNRAYDFTSHKVRPSWLQILTTLDKEYQALDAFARAEREAMSRFVLQERPVSWMEKLHNLRSWLKEIPRWLRTVHEGLLKFPNPHSLIARIRAAEPFFESIRSTFHGVLVDYDQLPLDDLSRLLAESNSHTRQVPQALNLINELRKASPAISQALCEYPWTLSATEGAIAERTWLELCQVDRELGRFDGRERQRHVDQLSDLYDKWLQLNGQEICRRVREQFLSHVRLSNVPASQLTAADREEKKAYSQGRRTLEHEFGKTMRYKSIRELVAGDSGAVIRDLKPVWLMSPLSVSDTLPMESDFVDVVIFDEASQVPLEEAVPPLFRGKQVIVVGDEMQLPPTDFFSVRRIESDEDELVVEDGTETARLDLGSDSFLNHAAKNLPATMLGWHYRSRSESLISFSNWAFYDGRLLTVPDERLPTADDLTSNMTGYDLLRSRPLSFHFLPAGVYDKRRNRAEADYIAQLVAELLERRDGLSIGVIAFSEAQQTEIEAALSALAQEDEDFRALYEEELQREVDGQFVGLLVKNLENIQGDERDVILLSICYGPAPNGKMLMNFGPINQSGGEKRLNVAFSRAKQYMAVVSSIRDTAITNDYNEGANCLKRYLRYAEAMSRGDAEMARRILASISRWRESGITNAADDAVSVQLRAALEKQGFQVDGGIGQSHFRVDLAVRKPGDSAYRLGILVDTLEHYEQADALERDLLRPRLLTAFGWRMTTVLAKDWQADSPAELHRLLLILNEK